MTQELTQTYRRFLIRWTEKVRTWAWSVVAVSMLATIGAAAYAVANFTINTDTTEMLSPELPWQKYWHAENEVFPQYHDTILVVVEGETEDLAADAALALARRLEEHRELFGDVFYPNDLEFLRHNGLLYLQVDELDELSDQLSATQPFLAALSADPSLRGLSEILTLAVDESLKSDPNVVFDLTSVLGAVSEVVEAQVAGRFAELSWHRLMGNGSNSGEEGGLRLILIQPSLDHSSMQPAAPAMEAIRSIVEELQLDEAHGVRVRLTGEAALETEELESVESGMGHAGGLSLTLVTVLLLFCFGSLRLILAALITLIAGLIWTFAFAVGAIGALNLISVSCAVLFIGLGIDFGIHYTLRYREALVDGATHTGALRQTARDVGGPLTICAIAAAISFYSFLPTDYIGLAELGAISGTGMLIALIANLTLLPALLTVLPATVPKTSGTIRSFARHFARVVESRARTILWGALIAAVAAASLFPQVQFDPDPDGLKDPNSESVAALRDLRESGENDTYFVSVLAKDLQSAKVLADQASKLDAVGKAITIADFVPGDQDEKLPVIESLAFILEPSLSEIAKPPPSATEVSRSLTRLESSLTQLAERGDENNAKAAARLVAALSELNKETSGEQVVEELQSRLLQGLPGRLSALEDSMKAMPFGLESIPESLRVRWLSADGRARVEIFPAEDLYQDAEARDRFVAEVRTVAPEAIGEPVILQETATTVFWAFVEAAVLAVATISVLLWVLLRNIRDIALVFLPLILAALLTVAASVLLNQPFNLANIIVLPLLFGLGVASSLQLVMRERTEHKTSSVLNSSTPRAVLFSALTTVGSFGSLAISEHNGISSMGLLLAIAISLTLVCTLIVTPALMAVFGREKVRAVRSRNERTIRPH